MILKHKEQDGAIHNIKYSMKGVTSRPTYRSCDRSTISLQDGRKREEGFIILKLTQKSHGILDKV